MLQIFPSRENRTSPLAAVALFLQLLNTPHALGFKFSLTTSVCVQFSGSTHRLTYAHKGGRNVADDPLAAGLPTYVMQEEFNRYQGYWWQPYSEGKQLLLLCRFNERLTTTTDCENAILEYVYDVLVETFCCFIYPFTFVFIRN